MRQNASAREPCTFGAVGDIVLWGPVASEMQQRGTSWLLEEVLPILGRADVLFGNLECAIVPPDFPDDEIDPRGMVGKFDGTLALKDAGFDFLNLANNHILDGGTIGLLNTPRVLQAHGILTGGVGTTQSEARQLHVLDKAGLRWGFLSYAEDSNYSLSTAGPCYAYYEPDVVLEDIAGARPEVDVLVVSIHADLEFMETPSPRRREAFRQFARAGATLVLGHHPHVPQGVEQVGDSLVAYSLGNFVFHAHTSSYLSAHLPNTARSFVLLAEVSRSGVQSFTRVPVQIVPAPGQRPVPATGVEAEAMSRYLEELDRMVMDDGCVKGNWRAASIDKLMTSLRYAASLDDQQAVLNTLTRMFLVAENRAWVDEVGVALTETWERQREHVDPHHRPSFEPSRLERPARRPALVEAAASLRRRLRR